MYIGAPLYSNVSGIVIDQVLEDEGTPVVFSSGTDYTIDSSREPDVLQVNLKDRSGNDSVSYFDQIGWRYDEDAECWYFEVF